MKPLDMNEIIEALEEVRTKYDYGNEEERTYYRALSQAIAIIMDGEREDTRYQDDLKIESLKAEVAHWQEICNGMSGEIRGLRFAIRCNGVSGNEVEG